MRQRVYVDGKLDKTTKPNTPETLRRWLDNMEKDWLKGGLCPLTEPGQFDMNRAHQVTRVSVDELVIVNTAGKIIRFVNV